MQKVSENYERYISHYRALVKEGVLTGAPWLRERREEAISMFSGIGLPTERRGNEKWKYTNIGPLARTEFSLTGSDSPASLDIDSLRSLAPWHKDWPTLVFVDGVYSDVLSSNVNGKQQGVWFGTLAAALEDLDQQRLVEQNLTTLASVENDGFASLNTAFLADGAFLNIGEGQSIDRPLHMVFVSTGVAGRNVSHPRVLIIAGAGSKASIIESYVGGSAGVYFTNSVCEMLIGDGADVTHYRLLDETEHTFNVGTARVRLESDGVFNSSSFFKGVRLGRYDLNVTLSGERASCELNGLYFTTGSQHIDNNINIDHVRPHGRSRLYYKGILDQSSRAVFGGTVLVREGAMKTDSAQSDKNLLLSPKAEVDTKPALFIYADDVKCGHGATAGNIDPDTIFYMRSRGIDIETASKLLIYGFADEIIDRVQEPQLRDYLSRIFINSLPSYRFEF